MDPDYIPKVRAYLIVQCIFMVVIIVILIKAANVILLVRRGEGEEGRKEVSWQERM